jgi:glycosyltransferase involved in cell wall biosynthesis
MSPSSGGSSSGGPPSGGPKDSPGNWRLPRRLAYAVSHSLPWSSNGYAVRSHAIARALSAAGHEVIVFSRPGRPWDIEGFPAGRKVDLDRKLDGIRYVSLPMPPMPGARPTERLRQAADILTEAFHVFRPAAVIAASNWENAEPARRAAGRTGAAFFYEQRGFWEMGESGDAPGDTRAAEAAAAAEVAARRQETEIALAARAVFTLNGPMRDELLRRGVPSGRIHLVPNGLSLPGRIDTRISRATLGCNARYLIGYIGSLSAYEGVEDLLHLVARLRGDAAAPLDVAALIVGSDAPKGLIGGDKGATAALRALAGQLSITPFVHFVPQQSEAAVASYYPLCDAIVLPRRRNRVTELVPPIKPYSAAAHALPVFMTDLPPLAEIAAEIHGSLYPEGDIAALAQGVRKALTHGHPATVMPLDPDLDWSRRVLPMVQHLAAVAEAERSRNARLLGAPSPAAAAVPAQPAADPDMAPAAAARARRFDPAVLPFAHLRPLIGAAPVALIGPGRGVAGPGVAGHGVAGQVIALNRTNLLEVLATAEPGRLVIDWAGLQAEADPSGDWAGLWSIDDMRLNRLVMDAARLALDRGWRLQVLGPVHRSQAPLFRTVANVMEELLPEGAASAATGAATGAATSAGAVA